MYLVIYVLTVPCSHPCWLAPPPDTQTRTAGTVPAATHGPAQDEVKFSGELSRETGSTTSELLLRRVPSWEMTGERGQPCGDDSRRSVTRHRVPSTVLSCVFEKVHVQSLRNQSISGASVACSL